MSEVVKLLIFLSALISALASVVSGTAHNSPPVMVSQQAARPVAAFQRAAAEKVRFDLGPRRWSVADIGGVGHSVAALVARSVPLYASRRRE